MKKIEIKKLAMDIIFKALSGFIVNISFCSIYKHILNVSNKTTKKGIALIMTIMATGFAKYAISVKVDIEKSTNCGSITMAANNISAETIAITTIKTFIFFCSDIILLLKNY